MQKQAAQERGEGALRLADQFELTCWQAFL